MNFPAHLYAVERRTAQALSGAHCVRLGMQGKTARIVGSLDWGAPR
jgi:hypothetical protein